MSHALRHQEDVTLLKKISNLKKQLFPRGGDTPYNEIYGESPPERGTFFRLEVYTRVRISRVEVQKRVRKTDILVFKRAF